MMMVMDVPEIHFVKANSVAGGFLWHIIMHDRIEQKADNFETMWNPWLGSTMSLHQLKAT